MDTNQDGFVTIDEFCKGLDEILPLPQHVKEGFFAYIDRLKIGVIDYHNFLKVMGRNINVKEIVNFTISEHDL